LSLTTKDPNKNILS